MCLIALSVDASHDYSFVLAANRDERHARPAAPADWWPSDPWILGGRDLAAGGTWLAVDRRRRVAAVTNYFEPGAAAGARSRGHLAASFLREHGGAPDFAERLAPELSRYSGFNLLLFDGAHLTYVSNRASARTLGAGIHAFGNADPDADWPKIRRARAGLAELLSSGASLEGLFDLLAERDLERPQSHRRSLFIRGREFGTRCSTVVLVRRTGAVTFVERRFDMAGDTTGESRFDFDREETLKPAEAVVT